MLKGRWKIKVLHITEIFFITSYAKILKYPAGKLGMLVKLIVEIMLINT